MRSRGIAGIIALATVPIVVTVLLSTPGHAQPRAGTVVPGQHIVVLWPWYEAADVAAAHGVKPDHEYKHALKGFAGPISGPALDSLRTDYRVRSIEPDVVVEAFPMGPPRVRTQLHTNTFETLTMGINRVDADLNPKTDLSAIGIAIIDTGIWLTHADLNVVGNVTFVRRSKSGNDDNGHGTHVAGIAAAKTNDSKGVRGVAPNARLFAVKVLDKKGSGWLSDVIKGVDWVTANAATYGIKVANMSLGCECTSSALNDAIHNSVVAGITYAVAAGNSSKDASTFSPANHPDVITVSAMADSDGKCGGTGPAMSYGADDTFATFSNFGPKVEIAAPGVDITSTWKDGLYATLSGTSMASPHVAGAAAQYIASYPAADPATVRNSLISAGVAQNALCQYDGLGGFTGDPDSSHEPLLYAATL